MNPMKYFDVFPQLGQYIWQFSERIQNINIIDQNLFGHWNDTLFFVLISLIEKSAFEGPDEYS